MKICKLSKLIFFAMSFMAMACVASSLYQQHRSPTEKSLLRLIKQTRAGIARLDQRLRQPDLEQTIRNEIEDQKQQLVELLQNYLHMLELAEFAYLQGLNG